MRTFASGPKNSYYGKGDVIAYRLNRDGKPAHDKSAVFGANVTILIYGDAFWLTYTTGDNTGLIATDSMKNFVQRETLDFEGADLESYCRFLATKFLETYPQAEGAQLTSSEIPYSALAGSAVSFVPGGPDAAFACIEMQRTGASLKIAEARSGLRGFRLLRLNGSSFTGFVRDKYTTLPDIANRPLHIWLDLEWTYTSPGGAFSAGAVTKNVRGIVHQVFDCFTSGSIQQIIHAIGRRVLADIPAIAEVSLEANNRTWDTVTERPELGVYTDSRPPYGCLALTLRR